MHIRLAFYNIYCSFFLFQFHLRVFWFWLKSRRHNSWNIYMQEYWEFFFGCYAKNWNHLFFRMFPVPPHAFHANTRSLYWLHWLLADNTIAFWYGLSACVHIFGHHHRHWMHTCDICWTRAHPWHAPSHKYQIIWRRPRGFCLRQFRMLQLEETKSGTDPQIKILSLLLQQKRQRIQWLIDLSVIRPLYLLGRVDFYGAKSRWRPSNTPGTIVWLFVRALLAIPNTLRNSRIGFFFSESQFIQDFFLLRNSKTRYIILV